MFPAFSGRYASLPDRMRAEMAPTPVAAPRLLAFNRPLAEALGFDLDAFDATRAAEVLGGNAVPDGATPIAAAYAGHQFGSFVPQLGDGRAILLGELAHRDGGLREVQLKGAGRTPFSRGGDGRAPIGPVLREYLVSEAMAALGVPTTRALAAVASGEQVVRQMVEPGAVLTRVASSHVRVGTFQYFAARRDSEALSLLVDFCIERHYPELADLPEAERALALVEAVVERQASLVAQWKGLGFIHGVMNTDNCAISGETIDYGPCAFMDAFHPHRVFSSIDERGRYAWDNQPAIAQWNLARLAETLLPLISDDQERAVALATEAIEAFAECHDAAWTAVLRAKLGLGADDSQGQPESRSTDGQGGPLADEDLALGEDFLKAMEEGNADFTLSFAHLPLALAGDEAALAEGFERSGRLEAWLPRWRERLAREGVADEVVGARLAAANPQVIPRNHLVEKAIRAAIDDDDLSVFETLLAAVTRPYQTPDDTSLLAPPGRDERVLRTFCGT
ncbi:YdiU family protein [Halomonas sp. DP1Y21-3]|uniref:protein adenylyltransferase SelO n=1 Tax=Halomonas sp. DP1Y21-3 TaxID=2859080 RepID=UPI001C97B5B3|nr:YdiU family protein [Halomonas sp. DP1Y21-3]MBY6109454.1 YdiU family protein [Halomonas sp. DP1Y21-3]